MDSGGLVVYGLESGGKILGFVSWVFVFWGFGDVGVGFLGFGFWVLGLGLKVYQERARRLLETDDACLVLLRAGAEVDALRMRYGTEMSREKR